MLRYNRKLKILIWASIFVIVLAVYCVWMSADSSAWMMPNNGSIELIDGKNLIIDNNNNFSLDLDTFNSVGETQTCTFVFKNNNSANAHVFVTFSCNESCLQMDGIQSFEIKPNETFEYQVSIKLIDYPKAGEDLPININFNTSYY